MFVENFHILLQVLTSEPTFYDATAEEDKTVVATLSNVYVQECIRQFPDVILFL